MTPTPSAWTRLIDAFIRLIETLTNTDRPDPEPPANPLTRSPHPDATTIDAAIYQTTALTDRLSRTPEHVVAGYLAQALTDAGYNAYITFGHEPLSLPDDMSGETLSAFAAQRRDGADLNLLLGDRNGGGLAYVGGKYALGPAGNIDRLVRVVETAPDPEDRLYINARAAAVHEVGHTLGGRHSDRMTDPPSMLFNNVEAGWMDSPPPEKD